MKLFFVTCLITGIMTLLSACEFTIKIPPQDVNDQYLASESLLYKYPQKVTENIYSAIGATAPPSYENSGHNNNLSFIITNHGVVVINAGASYLLAKALHTEIKKLTHKPIKYVILENAQGHAMLGSQYWQEQGAKIVAHIDADAVVRNKGDAILQTMLMRQKEKGQFTKITQVDITFKDKYEIKLGKTIIQALYLGPAHSPGDIVVWLPQKPLMISGDLAFHQRLLPVTEHTDTAAWITTWDTQFEKFNAPLIIPGHGTPTDLAQVRLYTRDYLQYLRSQIQSIIDNDGDLFDAYEIDMSDYQHLDTFEELWQQNIGRVFRKMEFDF